MHPIPGTEDLYYTIAEKKPLKRGNKTYYKAPAVIFGIDEEAGEVVSPNASRRSGEPQRQAALCGGPLL